MLPTEEPALPAVPAARALWRGAPCPPAAELQRRHRGAAGARAGGAGQENCGAGELRGQERHVWGLRGRGLRYWPRRGGAGAAEPPACGLLTLGTSAFRQAWFLSTCSPGRVRLWLKRGSLRRWLYLFMWLIKDVAGLMRGKCAPAGGSCLQPGFVVSLLGQDSPGKHLIVIECDHLLMSGESFKGCFGVLIFHGELIDCQIPLQREFGRGAFPLKATER